MNAIVKDKKRKMLMLSANVNEIPFIQEAKKMGFYVITTGNNKNAPGHQYSDEYIPFDYSDYEGIVELVKKHDVTAISQGCSDNCALVASYVGEKLGIKGHDSFKNAEIIHRKDCFKKFTNEYDIKSPKAIYFNSYEEAKEYDCDELFPLIIKPTDQAGGKGVTRVNNKTEYMDAIDFAFKKSNSGHIVVEQFIEGTLHSLSTFIVNKKVVSYCTYNDYSYQNKFMTNSGICPADNYEKAIKVLLPETEKIAQILELEDGLLHMQYIMNNETPWIIEMMRRSPGNNCTIAASRASGINWQEWILRAEAGENCQGIPKQKQPDRYYGYHAIMSDKNGIFDEIKISDEIKKYVIDVIKYEESGKIIDDYLYQKVGVAQFYFDNREEKDYYCKNINKEISCTVK